jgi:hypothetical protein
MSVSRSPSPDKKRETLPLASGNKPTTYGTDDARRKYAPAQGEQMVQIPASLLEDMMALAAKGAGVPEKESTIDYPDGSQYVGTVREGKPHGRGVTSFKPNGWNYLRFEGIYHSGSMQKGKMIYANGDRYEGEFEGNCPHGQGRYFFAKGDIYTGQFTQGKITGRGRYQFTNGETYEGMVVDNKLHGQGVLRKPNGTVHSGNFINDLAEGQGTKTRLTSTGLSTEKGIFHQGRLWNGVDISNGIGYVFHHGKMVFEGFLSYEEWAARYLPRPAPVVAAGGMPGGAYRDECFCTLV